MERDLGFAGIQHIWVIVERFYQVKQLYGRQYEEYEQMVAEYVEETGLPREEIRLGPEELARLLNFKELEMIRDSYLNPLKEACHELFRTEDSTDLLDRLVSDIFHELSILKEEHYNILTYEAQPTGELDRLEQSTILDEVHKMFPIKVHRLKHLFALAQKRMEATLGRHRKNEILIRSLYLNRDGFVRDAYPGGIVHFYELIFGKGAAISGFEAAGRSFMKAGFYHQAIQCFESGLEHQGHLEESAPSESAASEVTQRFSNWIKECRDRRHALELDV